jgi:hypothetical protein
LSGLGEAAEDDLEAEGAELADVVGDLPAGAGLAFVVVRAEVSVAGAGAGQELVVDLQLGVAEGDLGFGLAAAAGQPPVAGAFAGLGFSGGDGEPPTNDQRPDRRSGDQASDLHFLVAGAGFEPATPGL